MHCIWDLWKNGHSELQVQFIPEVRQKRRQFFGWLSSVFWRRPEARRWLVLAFIQAGDPPLQRQDLRSAPYHTPQI